MPPKPKAQPLTHFLCLPLATPQSTPALSASIQRFADSLGPDGTTSPLTATGSERPPAGRHGPSAGSSFPSTPASAHSPAISPTAVRPPGTIHLTLGVMSLRAPERLDAARARLRTLDLAALLREATPAADGARPTALSSAAPEPPPLSPPPLVVCLQGLQAMRSPQRTSVLYAEPYDASGRLPRFCGLARGAFVEAGLVVEEGRELKLHATMLNTVYVKGNEEQGPGAGSRATGTKGREGADDGEAATPGERAEQPVPGAGGGAGGRPARRRKPVQFDGRELIRQWKDEVWVEVQVERLAICEMGAKTDANGEVRYPEVDAKALP